MKHSLTFTGPGEVSLLADADYEDKSSYTFDVIATDNGNGLTIPLLTLCK